MGFLFQKRDLGNRKQGPVAKCVGLLWSQLSGFLRILALPLSLSLSLFTHRMGQYEHLLFRAVPRAQWGDLYKDLRTAPDTRQILDRTANYSMDVSEVRRLQSWWPEHSRSPWVPPTPSLPHSVLSCTRESWWHTVPNTTELDKSWWLELIWVFKIFFSLL